MLVRACLLALTALVLCAAPSAAVEAEYFNLPAGYTAGTGIAPSPDGAVWFAANPTGSPAPAIGRLTAAQAAPGTANGMAIFPTPALSASCCANATRSVAYDARNRRVWFVQNDGIVGWADPAAVAPGSSNGMHATLLSTALRGGGTFSPSLMDIAVAPDGLAWFTEYSTHNVDPYPGGRIASISSSLGVNELSNIALQGGATSLNSLRYDAKPAGIAVDALGRPWFAQSDPGNPGWRIATPNGLDYTEYLVTPCAPSSPCSGSFTGTGITDVAVAQDGSIWFTNQLRNEVGRLDLRGLTFTSYSLPGIDGGLAGGLARAITAAPDGSLWVAEYGGFSLPNANAIVKLVPGPATAPDPTATVFHLGRGKFPLAVAPDTSGNVWFALATDVAPGQIGRLAGVVGAAGGGGGGSGGGGPAGGGSGGGRVVRPVSVGRARAGTPRADGDAVTVDQICVGPPEDRCSLVYILSAHEYVTGFPGSRSSVATAISAAARRRGRGRRRARPRPVILGRKTVTLRGGQRRRVTVTLNATGRRLLRRARRLRVYFTVTQRGAPGRAAKRLRAVRLTLRAPRARRARRRR